MAYGIVEILETSSQPGGAAALLALPTVLQPVPGQYLLGFCQEAGDLLPTALFPSSLPGEVMQFGPSLPAHWAAGTRLALRGPLGNGFHLPAAARRVALGCPSGFSSALLPLAHAALAARAEITFYAGRLPAHLPAQVEVLPSDLLSEALTWADYLALDIGLSSLPELSQLLGLLPQRGLPCPAEALVRMPIPCGGQAECGVCAVHTRHGWKLGCKDGPVFGLQELLGG